LPEWRMDASTISLYSSILHVGYSFSAMLHCYIHSILIPHDTSTWILQILENPRYEFIVNWAIITYAHVG